MDTLDKHVFYDKLTFIYLEMPKFSKTEDELLSMFDKWMFALKNLSRLLERPKALQDRIFKKFFEQAEIARFTPKERQDYEDSIKVYRDLVNVVRTANRKGWNEGREKGREEGREEGRREEKLANALSLKKNGVPLDVIARSLGLGIEEVEAML